MPAHPASLRAFAHENGVFLTAAKVLGAALRRTRDTLLARRLRTRRLRIGRHPRLAGLAHIHIGHNFSAGDGLWLDAITFFAGQTHNPTLTIGPNANLSDSVHIACTHRIEIGEGFLCGSHVILSDHAHGIYRGPTQTPPTQRPATRPLTPGASVHIGRNVWIGDGCAILPGANIGDGAIIGANSVVTGPIPPQTIAVGAPARPIRRWNPATAAWLPIPREPPPTA